MSKVISVVNQKGGVGKTTTALNLAACLAEAGKPTLLVDMDPQGNATSGIGVTPDDFKVTVYEVLVNAYPADKAIIGSKTELLEIMPSDIQLAGAEIELASAIARETKLKKALQILGDRYDYVILDCPPSLGLLTVNAMTASTDIIVPMQCEYFALEGLTQLLRSFDLVKNYLNDSLRLMGILLTMTSRTKLSKQVIEEVKKYFEDKTFKTMIPRNIRLTEAPSYGESIIKYDPRSRGSEAYRKLAREILAKEKEA